MDAKIGVVIPCFKVRERILDVVGRIGPEVCRIYAVDDCCPENTGDFLERNCHDPRLRVIRNGQNEGVGGAVIAGYKQAIADKLDIIVKIDGDGQMAPELLPLFVAPLLSGEADYTKGNRFYNPDDVRGMPAIRLIGNAGLSFLTKFSSGYWNIFDPTNGFTAIHASVANALPLDKINKRYYFESDMLFRLNIIRAKVADIPMRAIYKDEKSDLSLARSLPEFLLLNFKNGLRRIIYNYFLRDFSVASLELVFGFLSLIFGVIFGSAQWIINAERQTFASAGTVMLAVLPILAGIQLLISFINYDVMSVPSNPIHRVIFPLKKPEEPGRTVFR